MANKTIPMLSIRRIIQLKASGESNRKIARILGIDRKTVNDYSLRIAEACSDLTSLLELSDEVLAELILAQTGPVLSDSRQVSFEAQVPSFLERLSKGNMTRMILWEDYRKDHPEGYSYSQFCDRLGQHLRCKNASMVNHHLPGAVQYFDYAGDPLTYVDPDTGELMKCPVFIAVLPYSGFTFGEVYPSQKREQLLSGMSAALEYFGGVTESSCSDNMAQFVKKTNRYEPVFEELAQQWSLHYNTTLMATRVARPKDKAAVESAVNTVYRRIYGLLEASPSFSMEELRMKFRKALDALNDRAMQKHGRSRREVFLSEEKSFLRPLPPTAFVQKFTTEAKVQPNYHIVIGKERHYYSVPFRYIGKRVKVVYDTDHVEIYLDHTRIAVHTRSYRNNFYSTDPTHMPEKHQHVRGWNEPFFLEKASHIGPNTTSSIHRILSQPVFKQQAYNSCLGVLRLAEKYGTERLEAAAERALQGPKITYTILSDILKRGLDKAQSPDLFTAIPNHENLRGGNAYSN